MPEKSLGFLWSVRRENDKEKLRILSHLARSLFLENVACMQVEERENLFAKLYLTYRNYILHPKLRLHLPEFLVSLV